jgi:hypothetical protein
MTKLPSNNLACLVPRGQILIREKRMRSLTRMIIAALHLMPLVSQAMTWSGCQTVTAVSDYLAFSNVVYVSILPGISGCLGNAGTHAASAVGFAVGQENVTVTNIASFLATNLTAMSIGRQVTVYYDETTAPQCYAQIMAMGGWYGQSP